MNKLVNKLKRITIINNIKIDFVASSQKLDNNWVLEEWYTDDIAIPKWWNEDYHVLQEIVTPSGAGFHKWCVECGKISDKGCKHNLLQIQNEF